MRLHFLGAMALLLAACGGDPVDESRRRGRDTDIVRLPAVDRASAYAAALRDAFEIPGTTILIDPRMLSAAGGYEETEERIPGDLRRALLATRTVQGECVPQDDGENRAPTCEFPQAGYTVRLSDVFDAGGDTLRLNMVAERYRPVTEGAGYASPFRMEERYHLVRTPAAWRVVRKERMRL